MDNYRQYIESIASGSSPSDVVLNSTLEHAQIVFEFLFKQARVEVKILTGLLNDKVYGNAEVLDAAISFMATSPQARISILSESDINVDNCKFLNVMVNARFVDRISVVLVPKFLAKAYHYHFCVVDNRHYRLEQNRNLLEATAAFGDTVVAPKLSEMFDRIKFRSLHPRVEGQSIDTGREPAAA